MAAWISEFDGLLGCKTSANDIYLQLCAFCEYLNTLNITWSIENLASSYMWSIEEYKKLGRCAIFVVFDSCVHGGSRKKATGLLTTIEALVALEGRCLGDHEHLEWGYTRTDDGIVRYKQGSSTSQTAL